MRRTHFLAFFIRLRPCSAGAIMLFACASMFAFNAKAGTQATDVEFNDQFLQRPGMPHIDVSRYDQGNPALPGVYQADLYVNQTWLGRTQVTL